MTAVVGHHVSARGRIRSCKSNKCSYRRAVYVCVCTQRACVCRGQRATPAVFPNPSLPYSLRWDLSLNLQLTDLAMWAAQQALGILSWPPLRRAGVATCPAMATCLRECQGSKLRPSYQSKVPLTELFSQPSLASLEMGYVAGPGWP